MAYPASPYVDERDGGLYVTGTRVSLDSIIISFQQGDSPQQIVQKFSTVALSQVYGVIAFYLENEQAINDYLDEGRRHFEQAPRLSQTHPELFARLEVARRQNAAKQS